VKPLLVALLGASLLGAADHPRIARATFVTVEKAFDSRLERPIENPFNLLGGTRGIYIDGFGAVFTAELNLVSGPTLSPFRPEISKQEIAALKQRKLERIPYLRQIMREMMVNFANALDMVPANEQIVLAVSLFHFRWEDSAGLPTQILMQASRQVLLNAKGNVTQADVKVQEY
jgi:hypothetical protein